MSALVTQARVWWWNHPAVLWTAFVLAHVWLIWLGVAVAPGSLGDVSGVYRFWVQGMLDGQFIVGVTTAWVYPIVALVPIALPALASLAHYVIAWLVMVTIFDLIGFYFLVRGSRRPVARPIAAWWWIAALLALGPVALGRIDSVVTPIAILGLLFLLTRPALAGALLAIGTWIKVWPAGLIVAALLLLRRRWSVALGAAVFSAVTVVIALVLGAGTNLLSFIGFQGSRGLQIEAPVATVYLWLASLGLAHAQVYFDQDLLTYQVQGDGALAVASAMTVVMFAAIIAVVAVVLLRRSTVASIRYLPAVSLALVMALIAFNKVGSPQYFCWIIPPILLGLIIDRRRFLPVAVLGLIATVLTQAIYPWMYEDLLSLKATALAILSLRNLAEVALFGYALALVTRRAG